MPMDYPHKEKVCDIISASNNIFSGLTNSLIDF